MENDYKDKAFKNSYVVGKSEFDEMILSDPIADFTNGMMNNFIEAKEKILKGSVEQGFNYVLIKSETVYTDNSATIKTKYHGFNVMSKETVRAFQGQGYEVYKLDKIKEYLKAQEGKK